MTGELVRSEDGDRRQLRISDADRERYAARLQAAVGEGRLELAEFEQRMTALYTARTVGDLEPLVADLPAPPEASAPEEVELRIRSGSIKRVGRWVVPRRLVVSATSGSVHMNFTEAVLHHPEVSVVLDVKSGSVVLVVPDGASADVDGIEVGSGTVRHRANQVPTPGAPRFRVSGRVTSGTVTIRYRRRFWRWTW